MPVQELHIQWSGVEGQARLFSVHVNFCIAEIPAETRTDWVDRITAIEGIETIQFNTRYNFQVLIGALFTWRAVWQKLEPEVEWLGWWHLASRENVGKAIRDLEAKAAEPIEPDTTPVYVRRPHTSSFGLTLTPGDAAEMLDRIERCLNTKK